MLGNMVYEEFPEFKEEEGVRTVNPLDDEIDLRQEQSFRILDPKWGVLSSNLIVTYTWVGPQIIMRCRLEAQVNAEDVIAVQTNSGEVLLFVKSITKIQGIDKFAIHAQIILKPLELKDIILTSPNINIIGQLWFRGVSTFTGYDVFDATGQIIQTIEFSKLVIVYTPSSKLIAWVVEGCYQPYNVELRIQGPGCKLLGQSHILIISPYKI